MFLLCRLSYIDAVVDRPLPERLAVLRVEGEHLERVEMVGADAVGMVVAGLEVEPQVNRGFVIVRRLAALDRRREEDAVLPDDGRRVTASGDGRLPRDVLVQAPIRRDTKSMTTRRAHRGPATAPSCRQLRRLWDPTERSARAPERSGTPISCSKHSKAPATRARLSVRAISSRSPRLCEGRHTERGERIDARRATFVDAYDRSAYVPSIRMARTAGIAPATSATTMRSAATGRKSQDRPARRRRVVLRAPA